MVPSPAYAGPSYATTQTVSTYLGGVTKDEPTTGFLSTTTAHVPSTCQAARYGCNSASAVNYDPLVTVNVACYNIVYGCLAPAAVNFACPDTTYSYKCIGENAIADVSLQVTTHYAFLCRWTNAPSPPPPPAPPTPAE